MNEPVIKEPKLTPKQGKFLKAYLNPESKTFGNGLQSALAVYDCKGDLSTAGAIASENLQKLKAPIRLLMEAKGIGLDKLLVTLNNGLLAKKIITSHTEPDKEIPDHAVRHKFLETAGRWLGVESPTSMQQINITISDEDLNSRITSLTAQLTNSKQTYE